MTDAKVTEGRVVEIISEGVRGAPSRKELLFVAVDDDEEAEDIARNFAGEASDLKVRSLGKLDAKNVINLGMRRGQVLAV